MREVRKCRANLGTWIKPSGVKKGFELNMNENIKRVWLDTATIANMASARNVLDVIDAAVKEGYTFVIANTVLDVKAFQEAPEWLEDHLVAESIIIEIWATPDQMTAKPFFWSSCQQETQAADSFEEAIENLPNCYGIMELRELMDVYGEPRGKWNAGEWAPPEPLSAEDQETLGLSEGCTRTDVLNACKDQKRWDVFDRYNAGYNRGLAHQHNCKLFLNTDGSIAEI